MLIIIGILLAFLLLFIWCSLKIAHDSDKYLEEERNSHL